MGSIPDLRDIVGRSGLVDGLVTALDAGDGVLLTGDRRVGKTCVARLVEARLRAEGRRVVRTSAERESLADFVQALADGLASQAGRPLRREIDRWRLTLKGGPVELSRQVVQRRLAELVAAAVHDSAAGRPARVVSRRSPVGLVLVVDEVPVLARALEREHRGAGIDLLRLLRRIRQEHSGQLSMLLLGSIGFHHVAGDAPGAMNDVSVQHVGALEHSGARYLARCLLLGQDVRTVDDPDVGTAVATAAEGIPYYIHHLVKACRDLSRTRVITPQLVPGLVDQALRDPDDPWNMRHYRDRIGPYYGAAEEDLVVAVLDGYADAPQGLTVDQLMIRLGTADLAERPTRRHLVRLVEKLEQDNYLIRDGELSRFPAGLVRRAWQMHQR